MLKHGVFLYQKREGIRVALVLTWLGCFSETVCLTCETVRRKDENFIDLSLDIVENNCSITHCLRKFSHTETLNCDHKFFCDTCCSKQEARKRMRLKKLPQVLAIHLKRFKFQESLGRYTKLAYRVVYPLQLRLFNTVSLTLFPPISDLIPTHFHRYCWPPFFEIIATAFHLCSLKYIFSRSRSVSVSKIFAKPSCCDFQEL